MTNEKAIEILEECWRYAKTYKYTDAEIREAFDMAIKALEQKSYKSEARRWKRRYLDLKQRIFKLEEQTRWIPVSERLPEEDGCYLVTTTGTNNDIIDIAYYTNGIWHKASRIKAWMPLPEPYKAESKIEQTLAYADQDTLMSAT